MKRKVWRFSPEIYIEDGIRTYSGGLGVLEGDIARSAADLGLSFGEMSLVASRGYSKQIIVNGEVFDNWDPWNPEEHGFNLLPIKDAHIMLQGRKVRIGAWEKMIRGRKGEVPVRLLTTNLPENPEWDRNITNHIHPGEDYFKFVQSLVLGIGGMRVLEELDELPEIAHYNEAQCFAAALELRRKLGARRAKAKSFFTHHTPVAAGNPVFGYDFIVRERLGDELPSDIAQLAGHDAFHTTDVLLRCSAGANTVSSRHYEIFKEMFGEGLLRDVVVTNITNGIHVPTWMSRRLQETIVQYVPEFAEDSSMVCEHRRIPDDVLRRVHEADKRDLVAFVNDAVPGAGFTEELPIIVIARRFAGYKRADLPLDDLERLVEIVDGKAQILWAGKAHAFDHEHGKRIIWNIYEKTQRLHGRVPAVLLSGYDAAMAKLFVAGGDLCLQMPLLGQESSATSFMKFLLNGTKVMTTRDGSVLEAPNKHAVYFFGRKPRKRLPPEEVLRGEDARAFYESLENTVLPALLESDPALRHAALDCFPFFSTDRVVQEYVTKLYGLTLDEVQEAPALPGTSTT